MSEAVLRERGEEAEDKHCDRADRTNPTSLIFLPQKNTQKKTSQKCKNVLSSHFDTLIDCLFFRHASSCALSIGQSVTGFLHEVHIMVILCNEKTVIVIITLLLLFSSGGRLREMNIMNIQGNGPV